MLSEMAPMHNTVCKNFRNRTLAFSCLPRGTYGSA